MKVCKFGGSSLAEASQMRKVASIVRNDPDRRLVVVSAPGKRFSDDVKVTDLLIGSAEEVLRGETGQTSMLKVVARFRGIIEDLELPAALADEITADLMGRLEADRTQEARFLDLMKSAGEDNCAKVMAAFLLSVGVSAVYVNPKDAGMTLTSEYGNARLLPESYAKLSTLAEKDPVVVFPGFFGGTVEGEIVTFPRGGSDITGSILAAAVKADMYENFTDVDNVFPVDPRVVPNVAEPIHELTYREMRELSYAGFAVFHDEAIQPAVSAKIPICIRNTDAPDQPGTTMVPSRPLAEEGVVGIASDAGFCTLYVSKYLMNREVGFGRRLLQVIEEEGISYEHAPSGIDDMSVVLSEVDFDDERAKRVTARIHDELGAEDVTLERGHALIMLVGEGMHFKVGVAATATRALADAGVNIEMLNQGASEISLMIGVAEEQREDAVRALYNAFFSSD